MINKPRVNLIVHNLCSNPIVRAAPIGLALQRLGFEVEVLGVLADGEKIYGPYADMFDFKTTNRARDVSNLVNGDLIYAFKPLYSTLLPAMISSSYGKRLPVLMDVEDDGCHVCESGTVLRFGRAVKNVCLKPKNTLVQLYTHRLRLRCESVTVSSTALQNFYGGTKLLHGPDEKKFDPARKDLQKQAMRVELKLPADKLLVLFAGKPLPHKGFDELVEAVLQTDCVLVLAGTPTNSDFQSAKAILGDRCELVGLIDNADMPKLLSAVDIVPVPQHDVAYARAQLPAKLIEAMSMGKAVIVTDVGDLPSLVGAETEAVGGWVVRPSDARDLAATLQSIQNSPDLRRERSKNARKLFLENASVKVNTNRLRTIFESNRRLQKFLK
jgi:glycosyltransferase involved in cell wall biosynthesis